ncbi:hypothetical protein L6164_032228 [Bauhinia variegata]|uniref:Uncharacterized protein n=1 Tax=Bauhinia variegata TaxID=167791 RepID=A0ACB9KN87_BAUVA|nr:hypothetical protein L6164_032228 [Bauhinia variegata]
MRGQLTHNAGPVPFNLSQIYCIQLRVRHQTQSQVKAAANMASEAPSWADQWGAGGIGAMEDDSTRSVKDTGKTKNSEAKGGFTKAKAVMEKIKSGTSNWFKWIKNQRKAKTTSK